MQSITNPIKNVLIASDFYSPHWTGIVKSIVNMTEALGDKFEFTVVTVKHDKNLVAKEKVGKATVYRSNFILALSRCYYSIAIIFRFLIELPKNEVVFISSPCSNILPFTLLSKVFRKRVVIFHQGDLTLANGLINRLIEKIFYFATLCSMRLADVVSTYTLDYAQQSALLSQFLPKFRQLLMPIFLSEQSTDESESIEKLLVLKNHGKIIFGFGGRFVDEKGFDVLLKAIPIVLKKIPNAHFAFAGETQISYESTYEDLSPQIKKYSEHISILGLLSGSTLRSFYDTIDYILIPSRSDCCPLVQMEACLAGRPSICSDIPGARYIVKTSGFGRLFESENSQDLADKIIDTLNNKESIQQRYPSLAHLLDANRLNNEISSALTG